MRKFGFRKLVLYSLIVAVVIPAMLLSVACTPAQIQQLEGILQSIDTANGSVTIVTKDGKTVTVNINSDSQVSTNGSAASVFSLEPGSNVRISTDDKGEIRSVEDRVAVVNGVISGIQGSQVSVTPQKGNPVSVNVTAQTQIRLQSGTGTINDLKVGMKAQAKYDPQTMNAFRIFVNHQEQSEVEGTIASIVSSNITVTTQGRRIQVTLTADNTTSIRIGSNTGTLADLKTGDQIHAKFDPISMKAYTIELQRGEAKTPPGQTRTPGGEDRTPPGQTRTPGSERERGQQQQRQSIEVQGTITAVSGNQITVQIQRGQPLIVTVDSNTLIKLKGDKSGTLADLKAGVKIDARISSNGTAASIDLGS